MLLPRKQRAGGAGAASLGGVGVGVGSGSGQVGESTDSGDEAEDSGARGEEVPLQHRIKGSGLATAAAAADSNGNGNGNRGVGTNVADKNDSKTSASSTNGSSKVSLIRGSARFIADSVFDRSFRDPGTPVTGPAQVPAASSSTMTSTTSAPLSQLSLATSVPTSSSFLSSTAYPAPRPHSLFSTASNSASSSSSSSASGGVFSPTVAYLQSIGAQGHSRGGAHPVSIGSNGRSNGGSATGSHSHHSYTRTSGAGDDTNVISPSLGFGSGLGIGGPTSSASGFAFASGFGSASIGSSGFGGASSSIMSPYGVAGASASAAYLYNHSAPGAAGTSLGGAGAGVGIGGGGGGGGTGGSSAFGIAGGIGNGNNSNTSAVGVGGNEQFNPLGFRAVPLMDHRLPPVTADAHPTVAPQPSRPHEPSVTHGTVRITAGLFSSSLLPPMTHASSSYSPNVSAASGPSSFSSSSCELAGVGGSPLGRTRSGSGLSGTMAGDPISSGYLMDSSSTPPLTSLSLPQAGAAGNEYDPYVEVPLPESWSNTLWYILTAGSVLLAVNILLTLRKSLAELAGSV